MIPARRQTDEQLAYAIRDLSEVVAIWDQPGAWNPKLPQYLDELAECLQEQFRRKHGARVVVEVPADFARRWGLKPI